jgi:hypothetical protein
VGNPAGVRKKKKEKRRKKQEARLLVRAMEETGKAKK